VTLQAMNSLPVDPFAIVMIASQIHLDRRTSWYITTAHGTIGCPDASLKFVFALAVMMAVGECFRHLIGVSG
jgi:hypothetical protein